jgi:hypothetical protein
LTHSEPAKLDQAGLVGMKSQSKLGEPSTQFRQKTLRLTPMLKPNDEVVGPPNHNYLALGLIPSPSLDPQVKYIV